MDKGPLVNEQIEAGSALVQEYDKFEPVKVAFWMKASDDEYWHLYIAAEQNANHSLHDSYREVLRLVTQSKPHPLDPFSVKLIRPDSSLAKAAIEIQETFPGAIASRTGSLMLGDASADDVYLYPLPAPVTP
jgi:hypothetical protein